MGASRVSRSPFLHLVVSAAKLIVTHLPVSQELDNNANIVDVRFTKSVIASKEAFTYEAAQRRKDDLYATSSSLLPFLLLSFRRADVDLSFLYSSLTDPLTEGIRLLNHIARQLRAKRMAAGALNLASPEVKIHLESAESSGPVDVETKELFETNSLVEEFMLLANISVAERIYKQFPQTAVLRCVGSLLGLLLPSPPLRRRRSVVLLAVF